MSSSKSVKHKYLPGKYIHYWIKVCNYRILYQWENQRLLNDLCLNMKFGKKTGANKTILFVAVDIWNLRKPEQTENLTGNAWVARLRPKDGTIFNICHMFSTCLIQIKIDGHEQPSSIVRTVTFRTMKLLK